MEGFKITGMLTNTKAPKDSRPLIIASKTKGNFRITPKGQEVLGVTKNDYVALVKTSIGICAFKGHDSDEENNIAQVGSKCAYPGKGDTGSLQFSSSHSWEVMGAENKYLMDVDNAVEQDDITYYPLVNVTDDGIDDEGEDGEDGEESED